MLAVLAALGGCRGESGSAASRSLAAPAATYDAFGFALLDRVAAPAGDRNVIISPVSAGLALSLVLEGATGATRDSLAAMLGVTSSPADAATRNAALIDALRRAPRVTLTVANALWARKDIALDTGFVRRAGAGYGAEATSLDLSSPQGVERVNAWVKAATSGKVPVILAQPLDPRTALVVTNAVYFKGTWESSFDRGRTADAPFHRTDGSAVPRPLMHHEGTFDYAATRGMRALRLPYRGGEVSMYVILADSGRAFRGADFGALAAAMRPAEVAVALPRTTLDCTTDLVAPLSALGAARAFDRERAELRGLLAPASAGANVWVSSAVQRVFVAVDEEGTVAAAATAVAVADDTSSGPVQFTVDRPYRFVLRHDPTGAILFAGRIADPGAGCDER